MYSAGWLVHAIATAGWAVADEFRIIVFGHAVDRHIPIQLLKKLRESNSFDCVIGIGTSLPP
jgi:hypothetical protein